MFAAVIIHEIPQVSNVSLYGQLTVHLVTPFLLCCSVIDVFMNG